jgi:hypothetical protein
MPFPTCEDGYNKRKLTLFASQVVDDFKSLPIGPKKVVELTEDSPTIVLDNLNLKDWKHITIYFCGVPGAYSSAKLWINGDTNDNNYRYQVIISSGNNIFPVGGVGSIGPPPGNYPTHWILEVFLSGGVVRMFVRGDNNDPSAPVLGVAIFTYVPTVENVSSITFYSGDDTKPYKAGTKVEVW